MYRKCPEHPVIKNILLYGEPSPVNTMRSGNRKKEASETEAVELIEAEFADICFRRMRKNGHPALG